MRKQKREIRQNAQANLAVSKVVEAALAKVKSESLSALDDGADQSGNNGDQNKADETVDESF